MVATGLVMWAVKGRQKYAKVLAHGGSTGFGLRLVEGLNVGVIAGVPIAMATYFWANRLVPVGLAGRPQIEIGWFFTALGIAVMAGLAWPKWHMGQAQLSIGGLMFAGVPILNAVTMNTHLGMSMPTGLWAVAGFDLTCSAVGAALLVSAAWWLGQRKAIQPARKSARAPNAAARGMAS